MTAKRLRNEEEPLREDEMTVREAGKKGGSTTSERYGANFYEKIGQKGGTETRELHGPSFYQEIGKRGGERVRKLIEKGKRAKDETDTKNKST